MAQYPTGSINAVPPHPEYVQTTGYCQMVPGSFKPNPDYDSMYTYGTNIKASRPEGLGLGNPAAQAQGIGQQGFDAWKDKLDFQKAQLEAASQQQTKWSSGSLSDACPGVDQCLGSGAIGGSLADFSNNLAGSQAWGGYYPPISHDCPHCGRCPSCGRGGYGYVPNYPPPIPYYYQSPNWGNITTQNS